MKFEIISKYADAGLNLPVRKTARSAGYDFEIAEDTVVPSHQKLLCRLANYADPSEARTLQEISAITKGANAKPTLIPTGIKCEIPDGFYLELSVRSSCPLKHWLILANGVGIIDADYYNNPDNEGHIYFQVINLSPFDIILKKGDIIGQGILKRHYVTDDDFATGERTGGFGSTSKKFAVDTIINATVYDKYGKCGTMTNIKPIEEECVMACNPERQAFIVGSPKNTDPDQRVMRDFNG